MPTSGDAVTLQTVPDRWGTDTDTRVEQYQVTRFDRVGLVLCE